MNPKKILNGKFTFKELPNGSVDKTKVVCVFCRCELSYHRSTSSLKYHLMAKHTADANSPHPRQSQAAPGDFRQQPVDGFKQGDFKQEPTDDFKQEPTDDFSQQPTDDFSRQPTDDFSRQPTDDFSRQPTDDLFRQPMDATTKNRLTAAIAKWVATECRPVSVVEDEGLADIIRIASNDWTYELPSSATVTSHVQSLRETERAKVQQALDKTNAVALTGDCWTSLSTHHYLGVTAHYLGPRWELRSHALTVVKTEERHSADAVAEHFLRVAREWDVEHKVVSLTTDGTRHMTAAARQLPFEHTPCVAHAVHRAVAVSLTDGPFDGALAACRKVVGHFRHSPARQAELERQQVAHRQKTESLAQEVSTRWNSTLEMIQGVQRNAGPLRDALGPHTAHHVAMPTATELEILKRLEAVLEHCRYVSELLGGEEFVSCSVVLPALCHLSRVMEVTEDEPAYMIKFKGTFTADMEGCKEKTNITWLRVATALDPRFKDLKCLSKPDRAEVWGTIRTLLRELERERPAQPDNQVTEPPTKKPTLMLAHESSSDEEEDRIELCLERYKAEPLTGMDDCPQEWWSTHEAAHGEMARLARKYLATPATSVPSERLFSLSGHVVQKKRASLLSENVNSLVCLSNWLKAKK